MHSPTAALAWELWRRHRLRFLLIAGTMLLFILVYPTLCARAGFDPAGAEATNQIARKFSSHLGHPSLSDIVQVLWLMFLAAGPAIAMVMTLLALVWIFTFCEFNRKTSDFLAFPARLFTLPISTSFLFWRLLLGGLAAVGGLYEVWTHCVPMPRLDIFSVYQNGIGWLTLLVLSQGIAWALAAWPLTRTVAWLAALFLFVCSPARRDIIDSPYVLPTLFLLGVLFGRVGLQKMRHGQWQDWLWNCSFVGQSARGEVRKLKPFASPAQAQLWFEWRLRMGKICLSTVALALIPVILILVRVTAGYPPWSADDMSAITTFLLGVPPFMYFIYGISPGRADQSFLLARPLAGGEIVMSVLKAAAVSVVLSWLMVLGVLALMPWLGDFQSVTNGFSPHPGNRALFITGLIFLCWRLAVINLCLTLTGQRWAQQVPIFLTYGGGLLCFFILQNSACRAWLIDYAAWIAGILLVVKFLLAFATFRESIKRRLLAPQSAVYYLTAWTLLVAGLLFMVLVVAPPEKQVVLPACLGVVLLVPLARIGFCPLSLAWARGH